MEDEYNIITDISGAKRYYKNNQLHREDGPAIEWTNGSKFWYINGERHREDGPAIERASGTKAWFINDKRHREDGPAIEYYDEIKRWYINGNSITDEVEEWMTLNNIPDYEDWTNKEIAMFKLKFL